MGEGDSLHPPTHQLKIQVIPMLYLMCALGGAAVALLVDRVAVSHSRPSPKPGVTGW